MAEVSWIPPEHLPHAPPVSDYMPVSRVLHKRAVPHLPLHLLNKDQSSPPQTTGELPTAKEFLDSVLSSNGSSNRHEYRLPSRPSPRVAAWKRNKVYGRMEWDSFTSSPRPPTSKLSTQRNEPEGMLKVGRTMAPAMFVAYDAGTLLEIFEHQVDHYAKTFKKPKPPSKTVPSTFPGYHLHRRIRGTWAYEPPDTRQEALNEWFVKRVKRQPPSVDKVHVAFGRTTYPFQFGKQKNKPNESEPIIEPPKMRLDPNAKRNSSVK